MPRRPRPADRPPPKPKSASALPPKLTKSPKAPPKRPRIKFTEAEPKSDDKSESELELGNDSNNSSLSGEDAESASESNYEEVDEDMDADTPRVAQWEPDDFEIDGSADGDENNDDEEKAPNSAGPANIQLASLQNDLSSLPLGTLRKAQRAFAHGKAVSDSEDNDSSDEDVSGHEPEALDLNLKSKQREKPEWSTKPRTDLAKRSNKHAPQEVTSKRPVTRRRTVVDVKVQHSRDPRFLPLAGEFSDRKFQDQYGFLADIHMGELKTLRENLKRAKKLLASSPRDLHEERQQEVFRLELAVKRAESSVNKDRREMVEQKAISQVAKEERDKQKQGKGGWWMKESDKKDLLVRARYDALATTGGKVAVKKAIEKKQKKISQKEKKSRPFARERSGGEARELGSRKRHMNAGSRAEGRRFEKRRRME